MKFLYEKVYSNQYFALVLFATIAVLLILFAIVLIAAINDTKKRKLAELDRLEKENIDNLQDKVNVLSNDEEVFGTTEAFKEESAKEPLEFFKSEDEQSKTRDIVLSAPTTENSMNNLLNEFDDGKEAITSTSYEAPIGDNNPNIMNNEKEYKDIVVPEVAVPAPQIQQVNEERVLLDTQPIKEKEIENIAPIVEVPQPSIQVPVPPPIEEYIPPRVEEEKKVEEIKEEPPLLEDNDDEFELPAIKNVNLEKSVNANDINSNGIDFAKTGILNFSNIESESYEIK